MNTKNIYINFQYSKLNKSIYNFLCEINLNYYLMGKKIILGIIGNNNLNLKKNNLRCEKTTKKIFFSNLKKETR